MRRARIWFGKRRKNCQSINDDDDIACRSTNYYMIYGLGFLGEKNAHHFFLFDILWPEPESHSAPLSARDP